MREEMKTFHKKSWYAILIIEILILLGTAFWGFSREKFSVDIPYDEVIGTTVPDDRNGWYVDNTFPLDESGLFDFTPEYKLPVGTYDITVRYETDTSANYSMVDATTRGFNTLRADQTPLQKEVHEVTYTTYLLENVNDFRVKTFFSGNGYMIIRGFSIVETHAFVRMILFMELLLFALMDILGVLYIKREKTYEKWSMQTKIEALLVMGIVFCCSYPLFVGGALPGHDQYYHLLRIDGIKEGLLSGQFPVKIQPNFAFGYGYAASTFYGDLFLYIPAILRVIGFSVNTSYLVFMLLMNVATVLIALYSFKKIWKDSYIPLLGTFLYTMAPYRLTNMYIRAAIGEAEALIFLPLVFVGMYLVLRDDADEKEMKSAWIPIAIGLSGLIQSHLLSCIMCGIFIIAACIARVKKVFIAERFITLLKALGATILLNIWFIFPFLNTIGILTNGNGEPSVLGIQTYGAHLSQLFNLFYNGAGESPIKAASDGIVGELPCGVGIAMGIGIIVFLLACIDAKDKKQKWNREIGILLFGILSLYLATMYFPWDFFMIVLGKLNSIAVIYQFPIRFLGIANVFLVVVTCKGLYYWEKQNNQLYRSLYCVILILAMISGLFLLDSRVNDSPACMRYDIDKLGTTDVSVAEYLLRGTEVTQLKADSIQNSENVSYDTYAKRYNKVTLNCSNESRKEGYIEVPLLYYPHYKAKDSEGKVLTIVPGDNNVLRVIIPAEYQGSLTIASHEKVSWRIAELISLIAFAFFVRIAWRTRNKQNDL